MQSEPQEVPSAPFFSAPQAVVVLSFALVAAHGLRLVMPNALQNEAFYWLALIPERLNILLNGGGRDAYGLLSLPAALVGHVTLHGDWLHVIFNAAMLLTMGAPVARRQGSGRFVLIFLIAAVAGAATYFALRLPDGAPAIGASGGVSGILAAAFLVMAGPRAGWPEVVSRFFLQTTAGFIALNVLLAFAGPSFLGASIAWDAHLGGYLGGTIAMAAFAGRAR